MKPAMQQIPLNQLVPAPEGVRKTQNKASLAELAASIKAHGLMMNLVVRPDGKAKGFAVLDGQRRLVAMQQLVKQKALKADYLVPCKVEPIAAKGDAAAARELSLAANVVREGMHPADEFEAFQQLVDKGMSAADIATRFGRTEQHVLRLLKLANVSPKILEAYRAGKLTLEKVQAFAITDDHKAQERILKSRQTHNAYYIREQLTEGEVPLSDERAKFVGLKAYEAAGGKVRRDLFANIKRNAPADDDDDDDYDDTPEGAYIEDAQLLGQLVDQKLADVAKSVQGEGWKWAEGRAEFDYSDLAKFTQLPSKGGKWSKEQMARAGVIVTLEYSGKAKVHRGLVHPDDRMRGDGKKAKAKGKKEVDGPAEAEGLSNSLVEFLTAHKSAALAAMLLDLHGLALAAVVHAMAAPLVLDAGFIGSAVQLKSHPENREIVGESRAVSVIGKAREAWAQRLAIDPDDDHAAAKLWGWCVAAKPEELMELLALCASLTLLSRVNYVNALDGDSWQVMEGLASAAGLNVRGWLIPNAANYYGRVSKPLILEALTEALPEERVQAEQAGWNKLKKGELAKLAERELAGTMWLPPLLRVGAPPANVDARTVQGIRQSIAASNAKVQQRLAKVAESRYGADPAPRKPRKSKPHPVEEAAASKKGTVVVASGKGSTDPAALADRDAAVLAQLGSAAPGADPMLAALDAENPDGKCRVCGCTNARGCQLEEGPCSWVEGKGDQSLCSNPDCAIAAAADRDVAAAKAGGAA